MELQTKTFLKYKQMIMEMEMIKMKNIDLFQRKKQ